MNYVDKETLPDKTSPRLLLKHTEEIKAKPDSQILHYHQTHELYMYEFFRQCKLNYFSTISVNGHPGTALAPIAIKNIVLGRKVNEGVFFETLLKAPVPFIFIPDCAAKIGATMWQGITTFKNGLIMDIHSACDLGIEFIASEVLDQEGIFLVYIGIIYE